MAKSMKVEWQVDRISALPDELLCHILSFVPTKVAVRTSVLSTRWRCLYTLVSTLNIVADFNSTSVLKPKWFSDFVDRVVLSPSRQPIQRFRLKWQHYIDPLQICRWMSALMCHNIKELELFCVDGTGGKWPYNLQLPACLFSCETLVALKLDIGIVPESLSMKIPDNAYLPNLKFLRIGKVTILGDQVEKLVSCCPILEDLVLFRCKICSDNFSRLNISSATLKRLTVCYWSSKRNTQIVINSPALEYLKYSVNDFDKQSLILLAKQSLVEVVINGFYWVGLKSKFVNAHEQHDVLKQINNIQSLQILDKALKAICDFGLPLFNKLTYLKMYDGSFLFDPRRLECLLARCVVLETLDFEEQIPGIFHPMQGKKVEHKLQQARLVGLLCHLKTIKIKLLEVGKAEVEALMNIVEFFLGNAKVLDKLTVLVRDFPAMQQLEITKELSILPRASNKCRVVLEEWRI